MKKIIVTGGLGFIGSNLIDLLLKKNFFVINIDKATYSSNQYNVNEFKNSKKYKFIKLDIKNKKLNNIFFSFLFFISSLINLYFFDLLNSLTLNWLDE